MPIGIGHEDVIPLINTAWPLSFGRVQSNKKAICTRGWFSPNRNLFLDPEIREERDERDNELTQKIVQRNSTIIVPECLNTSEGKAGSCLNTIIQHRAWNGGIDNHKRALSEGIDILKDLDKGRWLTSGFIVSRGIHSLNHTMLLQSLWNKKKREKELEKLAARKAKPELTKRISEIEHLHLTKPDMLKWGAKDCANFVQYKKEKGDLAMPKGIIQLRERCRLISGRASPAPDEITLLDDDTNTCFSDGDNNNSISFDDTNIDII
jgi:hypothetical protein